MRKRVVRDWLKTGRIIRPLVLVIASALPSLGLADMTSAIKHWIVYYGDGTAAAAESLKHFDLIVLDSDRHPPLTPLLERHRSVLGYLSIGEVNKTRSYFDELRDEGLLLPENPQWKGSYGVDVRNPRWTARVLEKLVPNILQQGFTGIFIDTIDRVIDQERADPVRWRGMNEAMVRVVRALRQHYPKMTIMVNRGYALWPELLPLVDMVVAESLMTTYDFAATKYQDVDKQALERDLRMLQLVREQYRSLPILTLDYWDPDDAAGIVRIYQAQRQRGFIPYVATIALDRIIAEPRSEAIK